MELSERGAGSHSHKCGGSVANESILRMQVKKGKNLQCSVVLTHERDHKIES